MTVMYRSPATPTITAGAYSSGDALGDKLQFDLFGMVGKTGCLIVGAIVLDKAAQGADLELVLFSSDFTETTDNLPFDPSDADLANCVGVVPIADHYAFNDNGVSQDINIGLPASFDGTALYGQLVVRGTPTYASTSDLTVVLLVDADDPL